MPHRRLQKSIDNALSATNNIKWSVCVRNGAGDELASFNSSSSLHTASIGKLLLLTEVARRCEVGELTGTELLGRDRELLVTDSGIWQHLQVEKLSIHDLCVFVASVSDNLATNVLLKRVGLQKIRDLSAALDLGNTALLDYVRNIRGPGDVETLSIGSASELSRLMIQMVRKELISQTVSEQLDAWLATGVDLSMVASAFGFDPLAHAESDRGFVIRNKTGTDNGIRADVGAIGRNSVWLSYAVIANWEADELALRDTVLLQMNAIGGALRDVLDEGLSEASV
jgi:beta-lactamase class A